MTSLTFSQLSPATGNTRVLDGKTEDQARPPDQIGPDFSAVFFAVQVTGTNGHAPEADPDLDHGQPQAKAEADSRADVPEEGGPFEVKVQENGLPNGATRDERGLTGNRTLQSTVWPGHRTMARQDPEQPVGPPEKAGRVRVSDDLLAPVAPGVATQLSRRNSDSRAAVAAAASEFKQNAGQQARPSSPADPFRQIAPIGTSSAGHSESTKQDRFAADAPVSPANSMPPDAMTAVNGRTGEKARQHPLDRFQPQQATIAGSLKEPSAAIRADRGRVTESRSENAQHMDIVSARRPDGPVAVPMGQPKHIPVVTVQSEGILAQDPKRAATEHKLALSWDDARHGIPGSQAVQGNGPIVAPTAAAAPNETAHRIAHQMVSAFVDSREAGTVDVRLNPKELGSVQMTLKAQDGGLALAILAERPETLDLMRRHIDQLSAEFRAMGYSDVAFSFGNRDTGAGSSRQETQDRPQVISSGADIEHGEADAGRSKISTGTLDIRL